MENLKDTFKNAKRIFILGDIHFGVRSSNMEWFEISKSYFEDFFIPYLKSNVKEGDILIQLGDVFENRQTVNLKINSYAIDLFRRLGEILPVITLAGNHDIYYKRTNEVTSLDNLKYIPNVYVFKQEVELNIGGKKCLIMPWRHSSEHEKETLDKFPDSKYVFCHSEMQGVMLNSKVVQEEGTKVSKFKKYDRVYSGHIHFSQRIKNVYMVGNAYQMTRSDIDNSKGIYILDLDTGNHEYVENNVTPKFKKLKLLNLLDIPLGEFKKLINNNFTDLYIPSQYMIKYDISKLLKLVQNISMQLSPNIYDELSYIDEDSLEELQDGYKNFDIMNLCKSWIDKIDTDDETYKNLMHKIKQTYTMASSSYDIDL